MKTLKIVGENVTIDKKELENHIKSHSKPMKERCYRCNKQAISMANFNKRTNKRNYVCVDHFKL